jgi:hypothetical protein
MNDKSSNDAAEVNALATAILHVCAGHKCGLIARALGAVASQLANCSTADIDDVVEALAAEAHATEWVTLQ